MPKPNQWAAFTPKLQKQNEKPAKVKRKTGAGAIIQDVPAHMEQQRDALNSDPEKLAAEIAALVRDAMPSPRLVEVKGCTITIQNHEYITTIVTKRA
jgi:hypothetical protein